MANRDCAIFGDRVVSLIYTHPPSDKPQISDEELTKLSYEEQRRRFWKCWCGHTEEQHGPGDFKGYFRSDRCLKCDQCDEWQCEFCAWDYSIDEPEVTA